MLGRDFHSFRDFLLRNIHDDESVKISQCDVHCFSIRGNCVGPGPAASGDVGGEIHLFQIDHIDLVRTHRAHVDIAVAAHIQSVVRLLDRQRLHNFLLRDVNDVDSVPITDRDCDVFAVRGSGTLVGTPHQLDRTDGLLGAGVDDPERMVRLDGCE